MNEKIKGAQKGGAAADANTSACENEFMSTEEQEVSRGDSLSASKSQYISSAQRRKSDQIHVCPTLATGRISVGAFRDVPLHQGNGEV